MGTKALRFLQIGAEATEGTQVPATTIWHGPGVIEDRREVVFVEEDVGFVSKTDASYIPALLGAIAFEPVGATFEQLPYLLAASIENQTTGVADGVGSGKIYQYDFNTTAIQAIKTYTIEGGDDQEGEEIEGAFVESFVIEGKGGEAWMMGAQWLGRQVTVAVKTPSVALPTVEYALFGKTKLFLDAIGGTIGTTQLVGTFLSCSLKVTTGHAFKYSGDGNLFPTIRYFNGNSYLVEFDVVFEHDTIGAARKVDWRAQTPRLIRIQCEGENLATAGTLFSKKTLRLDCAAKVRVASSLQDQDGNDVLTISYRSRYNPTAARHFQITVVNENSSLP